MSNLQGELYSEIQKLSPSSVIEMFEVDATSLGGEILRFHNGTNKLSQNLIWQGQEYICFPITITGFETSGGGQFPRPTATVSNLYSAMTTVLLEHADLIGAKVTRKRTFLRYLDAENFPGSVNPDADPNVFFPDDIFFIDRKVSEDRERVTFELASSADLQGVKLPARTVIRDVCPWVYRGEECGFTGPGLYTEQDTPIVSTGQSSQAQAVLLAGFSIPPAREALEAAILALGEAQDALADVSVPSIETRYNISTDYVRRLPGLAPDLPFFAVWDGAPVSLGSEFIRGSFQGNFLPAGSAVAWDYYAIQRVTYDTEAIEEAEEVVEIATGNVSSSELALESAKSAYESALANLPENDPVRGLDKCGKRLSSCKLRFSIMEGTVPPLPFGGFPGVGG